MLLIYKKIFSSVVLFSLLSAAIPSIASPTPQPPRPLTAEEQAAVEAEVKNSLKDPDSAKFMHGDYLPGGIYCGEVNAKNSYGGYVGRKLFAVSMIHFSPKHISTNLIGNTSEQDTTAVICGMNGYNFSVSKKYKKQVNASRKEYGYEPLAKEYFY